MLFEFAERTIAGIIFAVICVALFNFFGQSELFDLIILVSFISIALFFRRNRDLLFICLILIAERGMEELMWRTLENDLWVKIPSYLIFMIIGYQFARGGLRWFSILFFGVSLAVEAYLHQTIEDVPFTLFSAYVVAAAILVRHALRRRVFWQINLWGKRGTPMILDNKLLDANASFIALYVAFIAEIYISFLSKVYMDYIYQAFPYISQCISLFIVYNILLESLRHLRSVELHA